MQIFNCNNVTDAFYNIVSSLNTNGVYRKTEKVNFKEISPLVLSISRPQERFLVVPYRGNSIISTIAETIWVLSGKDEINFLNKYLPRAKLFSEDGKTWSAAYGKRLQDWYGINQIFNTYEKMKKKLYSRRYVMTIYDPKKDSSHDIIDCPCNNWLQLIVTPNNKLNFYVTLRANDVFWGFSGINFFEWSVIQELIAYWLKIEVGEYVQFVGSMNLFERHFERTNKVLENKIELDLYSTYKNIPKLRVDIDCSNYYDYISSFFEVENNFTKKSFDALLNDILEMKSEFLKNCLLALYCNYLYGESENEKFNITFNQIPYTDLKIAMCEYFIRKKIDKVNHAYIYDLFSLW